MSRTNAVTGMVIDERLKRDTIIAALTKVGGEHEDDADTETLATQLHLHYSSTLPKEKQIRCKQCKGIGDADDDVCPHCGHDEGEDVVDTPPPKNGTTVKGKTEAKPMTTEAGEIKDTKKDKAPKNGKGSIVKDDTKPSSQLRSERDLDDAVNRVKAAVSNTAVSGWKLGKAIAEIKDNDLWKLRTHKDGKTGKERPRWSSWEAFCTTELGMTPRNALGWAKAAANFTEDQFRAIGVSKLPLILAAPAEAREETRKLAESGASASEIRKHVKKARAKSKSVVKTKTSKASEAAAKARAKNAKHLTVANMLGSVQVKLFKKPESLKNFDEKTAIRAKKLADEPFGVHELENGVVQYFTILESPAGELILKVVTKREDD